MTPIAPPISAFLRERLPLQRGASDQTCDRYASACQLLCQFASARLPSTPSALRLEPRDAPFIMAFLHPLETARQHTPRTRHARLVALKSFRRLVAHRVPSVLDQSRRLLAIPAQKTTTRLVSSLSVEERQSMLKAPDLHRRDGIRDRAMLQLGFAAGLRGSEVGSVPLTALEWPPTPSVRIRGKGRKERLLPLWKQTATALRAWLAVRGDAPARELFVNARGLPMTRSGFEDVLHKHVQTAAHTCTLLQHKRVSPHVLRHTSALVVLQATGDSRKVALWLGHADIQTTEMSLRADPTEKREALDAMVPPTRKRGQFRVPDKLIALLHGK